MTNNLLTDEDIFVFAERILNEKLKHAANRLALEIFVESIGMVGDYNDFIKTLGQPQVDKLKPKQ